MNNFFESQITVGAVCWIVAGVIVLCALIANSVSDKAIARRMSDWEATRLDSECKRMENRFAREKDAEVLQIRKESEVLLRQWKSEYAAGIRQDAIARSKAVIAGRVAENIAPFLPEFPFNPKDARFLGNPVDFIVFDGLDNGELHEIVLLEMKTETSRLTQRQKEVRLAIEQGRFSWHELRLVSDATANRVLPEPNYDDIT